MGSSKPLICLHSKWHLVEQRSYIFGTNLDSAPYIVYGQIDIFPHELYPHFLRWSTVGSIIQHYFGWFWCWIVKHVNSFSLLNFFFVNGMPPKQCERHPQSISRLVFSIPRIPFFFLPSTQSNNLEGTHDLSILGMPKYGNSNVAYVRNNVNAIKSSMGCWLLAYLKFQVL